MTETFRLRSTRFEEGQSQSLEDIREEFFRKLETLYASAVNFQERTELPLKDFITELQGRTKAFVVEAFSNERSLTDQEKAREIFFRQIPLAKFAERSLIPALVALGKGDENSFHKALQTGMPRRTRKRILRQMKEYSDEVSKARIPLTNEMKQLSANNAVFDALEPQGILLTGKRTDEGQVNTPHYALGRILEKNVWTNLLDEAVYFYYVDILHPLALSRQCGCHDPNLGIAWIDRRGSILSAQKILENPQYKSPQNKAFRNHIRYKKPSDLAECHEGLAFCEEVKHRLNGMKKERTIPLQDPDERYLAFTSERLQQNHPLHRLWARNWTEDQRRELALSIEECNAKLFAAAFGPDPQCALADAYCALLSPPSYLSSSGAPNERALMAATLLERNPDDLHFDDLLTQLKQPNTALRLRILESLQKGFHEEWHDLPFCEIDSSGDLQPHKRTHPVFSKWSHQSLV